MAHYLVKTVRKLAEENPDYVDSNAVREGSAGCMYAPPVGNPCIIGQAFAIHGKGRDAIESRHVERLSVTGAAPKLGFRINLEDMAWLRNVQANQDEGIPWGEAVRRVDRTVEQGGMLIA